MREIVDKTLVFVCARSNQFMKNDAMMAVGVALGAMPHLSPGVYTVQGAQVVSYDKMRVMPLVAPELETLEMVETKLPEPEARYWRSKP